MTSRVTCKAFKDCTTRPRQQITQQMSIVKLYKKTLGSIKFLRIWSEMEKKILDTVGQLITQVLTTLEKKAGNKNAGGPPRPMKFPYTFTAKVMQFPWRFYIEKNWIYKYYVISIVLCIPIFWRLERLCECPFGFSWFISKNVMFRSEITWERRPVEGFAGKGKTRAPGPRNTLGRTKTRFRISCTCNVVNKI